jgi:diguanylate cyclase (GGDEF)-like protein
MWQLALLSKAKREYAQLQEEFSKLSAEDQALKKEEAAFSELVQEMSALYDITREICRHLDDGAIFSSFIQALSRYIRVKDCRFLRHEADLLKFPAYQVFPLKMHQHAIGYLVVDGLKEEDAQNFRVLSQQFLLGVQRAFLYQKVSEMAIRDSLTGLSSRRHLLERYAEEIERSRKSKYRFCLLMVDIDYFKKYNDFYGHFVGDAILREVSRAMKESIRSIDLVGRYGGEEFLAVITETDREGGRAAAERIRQAVESSRLRLYDEEFKITVSIGVSLFPDDAAEAQPLIDRADGALYQAKNSGRNRVCVYGTAS